MKKIIARMSLLLAGFLFFAGCDTVEAPYVEGNPFTCDYNSNLPTRKVLIEDFTGYQCVNCPRATAELHAIIERYPCHVVPVAIHYGFFAEPFSASDPDYRAAEAATIGSYFEITEALPIGMVNRQNENGNFNIQFEDWNTTLFNILLANHLADVEILCSNSFTNGVLSYTITANPINDLGISYNLVAMITEDKVIGMQKDGSILVNDYEHNHMLRTGLLGENTAWGIPVSLPYLGNFSYTWPVEAGWVPENCNLVVYVYNNATKEVIQVEQFEIATE
jgi:hypothetical protein